MTPRNRKFIEYIEVAQDTVMGALLHSEGLSKGEAKHLMKQGVNTIKNFRGLRKTAKYYISQTKKMFYKPLLKDSLVDLLKGVTQTLIGR